ncbi:MAG: (2Fe-2S)-binding protein [Pseudomonadota bacterium]|nr:(2Fe-2S)-binding protein [Pseudomonadota bacterium]MEC8318260.1 (2Fe-2S)-binding protein [Pseudomonadota bacterium]
MYVCICNALTDKQVLSAIASGCARPSEIYSRYQTAPQCGKCALKMNELIERQNATLTATR